MIKFVAPRYGNTHVFVYVFICSIIGSLSVMCCKAIGLAVRETLAGSHAPSFWAPILLLVTALVICISVQMIYLQKALDVFQTAIVNPVHYVLFTSLVILSSSILFQEWCSIEVIDAVANIVGLLVVIVAIFMLNAFRDIPISLSDLKSTKPNA